MISELAREGNFAILAAESMRERYDLVVAGAGAVGSAALYAAAKRGLRACAVERFALGHDRGSSHGESRIIRKAYFLHPDYIPLLNRAYELWEELAETSGSELMVLNGLLCAGEPGSGLIRGLERCYSAHALPHERMTAGEAMRRWPQYTLPETNAVYFDPTGGFLRADRCLSALQISAKALGAAIHDQEPMEQWEADGEGVTVWTGRRTIHAGRLVMTNGAWVAPELVRFGIRLRVRRKVLFWYPVRSPERFLPDRFPAYICEAGEHDFYGFPTLDGATMKNAEDTGGQWITDPEMVEPGYLPEDEQGLRAFLERTFPGEFQGRPHAKTCLYTLAPDHNFVVGPHPECAQVVVGSCCSGHGFKLASAMGEILVEIAMNGRVPEAARFLSLERLLSS